MEANLRANGIDFDAIPKIVQFNKRDLPDIKPLQEIRATWGDIANFTAVASKGEGVIESLRELLRKLYRHLDAKHQFATNFGVSEEEFLGGVFRHVGRNESKAAAG
jgi:50S ribosomal subunit-associated GTPase HflX